MLYWGIELDKPIEAQKIAWQQAYFVDENATAAFFADDESISEDFVKESTPPRGGRHVV